MKRHLLFVLVMSYVSVLFSCNSTENRRILSLYNSFSISDHFEAEMVRLKNAADFGDVDSYDAYEYIQSFIDCVAHPVLTDSAKRRLILTGLCDEDGSFMKEVSIAIQAKANENKMASKTIIIPD